MSVNTTRARITALQAIIPGITAAFTEPPRSLATAELPAFITRVGDATYDRSTLGEEILLERRVYRMQLFVAELGLMTEGEAEDLTVPFVDTVRDFFLARPGLQLDSTNDSAVYSAILESDTGAVIGVNYPGDTTKRYAGIEFVLRVTEYHPINYVYVS